MVAAPADVPPLPVQQRVARYEEVVEDDGQVVVHVPDSAAGPDGIIRLLQVTNEDGSVHYISADHTGTDSTASWEGEGPVRPPPGREGVLSPGREGKDEVVEPAVWGVVVGVRS